MSSCKNKNCKNCICNKNEENSELSWGDDLHEIVEAYAEAFNEQFVDDNFFSNLPKTYQLILVDSSNPNVDYELSYRKEINVVDMASILRAYFGIEIEVTSKFEEEDDE